MVSKKQFKLINSLKKKKYRLLNQLFFAEGIKVVEELIMSDLQPYLIFCTEDYINKLSINDLVIISEKELKSISEFSTPNKIFAIFKIPEFEITNVHGISLVLDSINDPGNLGAIIRLCDWYGVHEIICSKDTVDCYNSKVVQSSMGSISRVSILYADIENYLKNEERPIYGAMLEGENIYQKKLPEKAVLILGNEANGISEKVQNLITSKITIPQFGELKKTESLNVATATAILLSEFHRN